jgi:TonB family protein
MTAQNNIQYFTPSGCLTLEAMNGLQSSNIDQKDLQDIRTHLENCKLCQDAFEGFTLMNDPDKINEIATEINYNLKSKLNTSDSRPSKPYQHIRYIAYAAASVIILLGLFFMLDQSQKDNIIKQANNIEVKEEMPAIPIPFNNANQNPKFQNPSIESDIPSHTVGHKEDNLDDAFLFDKYESREFYLEPIILSTIPSMNLQPTKKEIEENTNEEAEEVLNIELGGEGEGIELRADPIFTVVEQMPEFPEGYEELSKYLKANLKYPQEARENEISGKVFISFIVEESGNITNATILRGIGGGCDEAAIEVIESMPNWIPGKQKGKAVKVQFNMPIVFKLN